MNAAQQKTLNYWNQRYPALVAQAVQNLQASQAGFGQTSDFSSVMDNLTNLLTSYGQYKIASDVANSGTSANRGVLNLPATPAGAGSTNWVLIGGVGLLAIVGLVVFMRKRR